MGVRAVNSMELAGTEWGFPGEVGKDPRSTQFGFDGRLCGSMGCNRFAGSYSQDGHALTIGTLATTRRACLPEVMQRERQFLAILEEVRRVEASCSELTLKDADGNALGELRRRDVD
jgi:heat shock protein HslJ